MEHKNHSLLALRVGLGVLFVGVGLSKLMNPDGVVGMLSGIGFPIATFWAWVLILAETLGGLCILIGLKSKKASWPLIIVMIVAILTVSKNNLPQFLKDFSILGGLVALALAEDSGCCSVDSMM